MNTTVSEFVGSQDSTFDFGKQPVILRLPFPGGGYSVRRVLAIQPLADTFRIWSGAGGGLALVTPFEVGPKRELVILQGHDANMYERRFGVELEPRYTESHTYGLWCDLSYKRIKVHIYFYAEEQPTCNLRCVSAFTESDIPDIKDLLHTAQRVRASGALQVVPWLHEQTLA